MVQTRAATKRVEPGTSSAEDTTIMLSPTKKCRQDSGPVTKKRRRGKPGELCQLNLDVLFLLAAYIHPLDLLSLARTCKSLRQLLMDKSSMFVWKTARRQVKGLPDCPTDLTEPEYANLIFYTRCHGCGKYAKKILWNLRRRYCPDCRNTRLCLLNSCAYFVRLVLPAELLEINDGRGMFVDVEQLRSITREHRRSTNKHKFLQEKQTQYNSIYLHASACQDWENKVAAKRQDDLKLRRDERHDEIFERLKQHGYEREIAHFGHYQIQRQRKSFFRKSKPLTDKEWALMLPQWVETMKDFTLRRMEATVYRARRQLLISAYDNYKASRSSNSPVFEILPHATEVARFTPFQEVIHAPEEARIESNSFESAFEQLPRLVGEWKRQLDVEFSELVKIPSDLSLEASSSSSDVTSSSTASTKLPDKLQLACAMFARDFCQYGRYPEVLSWTTPYFPPDRVCEGKISQVPVSIKDQYNLKFVVEAAYIVRACGLDPNVATVEDMDSRNARLKCLACSRPCVMNWWAAVRHALRAHPTLKLKLSDWQLIDDKYIDAILAAELSFKKDQSSSLVCCLLCHPCVGGTMFPLQAAVTRHMCDRHGLDEDPIQQGVHYKSISFGLRPPLEIVNEGDAVMFVEPSPPIYW